MASLDSPHGPATLLRNTAGKQAAVRAAERDTWGFVILKAEPRCSALSGRGPSSYMTSVAAETCALVVSPGDAGVGIAVVADPVCKTSGGLGCSADSVCRYCKTKSTPQSQHLVDCSAIAKAAPVSTPVPAPGPLAPAPVAPATSAPAPSPTTSNGPTGGVSSVTVCAHMVSTGNAAVGIDIVSDVTCANGGLGCIDSTCRFCKNRDIAQSGHYLSCQSINPAYGSVTTPAPASPAPKPTTSTPPVSTTAPPAPATSSPPPLSSFSETCSFIVSPGDASVGIVVLADASCKTVGGGVGCFGPTSVCRYCKSKSTPQSDHLRSCDSFSPSPSPSTSTNPVAVVATPTPTTALPSTSPPASTTVSSGGKTVQPPPADLCSDALITSFQATSGIWAVFDPSCPRDCNEYCRMCQFIDTSASTTLRSCSGVLATVAVAAADSGVWSSSALVLPNPPPANQCTTTTLTPDTVNSGIWMTFTCLTVDPSGTSRCLQAKCAYCKYFESPSSSDYPPCDAPVSIVDSEGSVRASNRKLRLVTSRGSDDDEKDQMPSANAAGSAGVVTGAAIAAVLVLMAVVAGAKRAVHNFHWSLDAEELP